MKTHVSLRTLAIVGWSMYYKGYTKEELDSMSSMEILFLNDDFERWIKENDNK